jgi:hypothetical protein
MHHMQRVELEVVAVVEPRVKSKRRRPVRRERARA